MSVGGTNGHALLKEAIRGPGTTVEDADGPADLLVVITDHCLNPDLAAVNQAALANGAPWLLAKVTGGSPWTGPLFRPGVTACWACLAERLRLNRQVENCVVRHRGYSGPPNTRRHRIPSTPASGVGLVSLRVAGWPVTGSSPIEGQWSTFDSTGLEALFQRVVRRPSAPRAATRGRFPRSGRWSLVGRAKRSLGADGHRAEDPEDTVARLVHHISPLTGVVSALVEIGHERGGVRRA